MLDQVGQLASSKSAMKVEAPELSALITILRSVGPVISTRRSSKSFGCGEIVHSLARRGAVSAMKSGNLPASNSRWRAARRASRSWRRDSKARCSLATKLKAAGVRTRTASAKAGARISTPAGRVVVRGAIEDATAAAFLQNIALNH